MREVAFITGGAVGFGRQLARSWIPDGVAVSLADVDLSTAEATAEELRRGGGEAIAVECDVADPAMVVAAVASTVDAFGGVDILINNAALHLSTYSKSFADLGPDKVQACVNVNIMGIVHAMLACRDTMAARGRGRVVNLSSSAGYEPRSIYGVTKLAVRGPTTAFADEFSSHGVRVNAVAPGLMATEAAVDDLGADFFQRYSEQQLARRSGTMDDVVNVIRYLCSAEASFITGETVRVTGGYPLAL